MTNINSDVAIVLRFEQNVTLHNFLQVRIEDTSEKWILASGAN